MRASRKHLKKLVYQNFQKTLKNFWVKYVMAFSSIKAALCGLSLVTFKNENEQKNLEQSCS